MSSGGWLIGGDTREHRRLKGVSGVGSEMSTATAIRERPILMSAEMVRAILDGRKTQTRRVVSRQPHSFGEPRWWLPFGEDVLRPPSEEAYREEAIRRCPYGQPGDRLYVRETWAMAACFDHLAPKDIPETARSMDRCYYRHGGKVFTEGWHQLRPSIHMPKWAARIWLEVTAIRVGRVQQITEEDAEAEGVNGGCLSCGKLDPCGCLTPRPDHRDSFVYLWDSLNAKRGYSWESNPWVFVVEFSVAPEETDDA